ncbi:MAG: hypothetical protein JJU40_16460 [Rhodobacteraceae bacterium]|nr:hypothetical protein [Paracoccaceae bacterium]
MVTTTSTHDLDDVKDIVRVPDTCETPDTQITSDDRPINDNVGRHAAKESDSKLLSLFRWRNTPEQDDSPRRKRRPGNTRLAVVAQSQTGLHVGVTRAPNVWRQTIAATHGQTDLLAVALPPASLSPNTLFCRMIGHIARDLAGHHGVTIDKSMITLTGNKIDDIAPLIVRSLHYETFAMPRVEYYWCEMQRLLKVPPLSWASAWLIRR